jgi:hypothetical protein
VSVEESGEFDHRRLVGRRRLDAHLKGFDRHFGSPG